MILIRPVYVLLLSSIMLIASALLAFVPYPGYSWQYRGVYTVMGIEKHDTNNALQVYAMQDEKLQCRIVKDGDGLKLNMVSRDKTPQEISGLMENMTGKNMVVLHQDRGLKELVGYFEDDSNRGSDTRVFLKKIR